MTARDRLNRRSRPVAITMYLAILFIAIAFMVEERFSLPIVVPSVIVVFLVSVAINYFLFRCDHCLGNLAPAMWRGSMRIDKHVGFCPYCGISIDVESPEKASPRAGVDAEQGAAADRGNRH